MVGTRLVLESVCPYGLAEGKWLFGAHQTARMVAKYICFRILLAGELYDDYSHCTSHCTSRFLLIAKKIWGHLGDFIRIQLSDDTYYGGARRISNAWRLCKCGKVDGRVAVRRVCQLSEMRAFA